MKVQVQVYYNEVTTEYPYIVRPNCPYEFIPLEDALEVAEGKVASGEWLCYLIPDLMQDEVTYEL